MPAQWLALWVLAAALLVLLAGCATAPPTPAASVTPAPAGLVLGTVSYAIAPAAPRMVVEFEGLQPGAAASLYVLPVQLDDGAHRGLFAGTLPAGVYVFRGAASGDLRFATAGVHMPFEVAPGAITDAGHYKLGAGAAPVAATFVSHRN